MYCGKTADWIRIPFGIVNGIGQEMGILDGVMIVEGKGGSFGVNLGVPYQWGLCDATLLKLL